MPRVLVKEFNIDDNNADISALQAKDASQDLEIAKKDAVNKIINGGFDFWQRGTSFSPGGNVYGADRWSGYSLTVTRQSVGNPQDGQVSLTEQESGYFLRASNAGTSGFDALLQRVEGVHTLAGKKGIVALDIKGSVAGTINHRGFQNFGSGGSTNFSFGWAQIPVTTSWNRVYIEVDYPSVAGKTIGSGSNVEVCFDINVSGASETSLYTDLSAPISAPSYVGDIDIKNVMLYEATHGEIEFQRAGRDYAEEFQRCQRYARWGVGAGGVGSNNTGYMIGGISFDNPMRTVPTLQESFGVVFYFGNGPTIQRYANSFIDAASLNSDGSCNGIRIIHYQTVSELGNELLAKCEAFFTAEL